MKDPECDLKPRTSRSVTAVEADSWAQDRAFRVLSDLPDLPTRSGGAELQIVPFDSRPRGPLRVLAGALRLYREGFRSDAIFFNQPTGLLFMLCALRTLAPFGRARLVAFDIILPRPGVSLRSRAVAAVKRRLLRQVGLFILHLKEPGALEVHYGIARSKSVFVPFKVNGVERGLPLDAADDGYILAPGRSWRDYPTFCRAMAKLPFPAKILMPDAKGAAGHGTLLFAGEPAPPNVELVRDDGSSESWNRFLSGARLVVLPISADAISAAGNGTYILAMAMGKCVVITDCPGVRGILEDGQQALIVPPADPEAMAAAIRRVWEDDALRSRLRERGRAYATSLGGERRLYEDLARETVAFLRRSGA